MTAYQSNDFARAAAMFENATSSRNPALQQRSLYNLGNTEYRLGQVQPSQAQQLWERALKNYETAMALDPQDADAKFNHDFVKKKLEELKKQQQKQQQEQNQQDQPKQQQEQKKDEQKQQDQSPDQQQQNSSNHQSGQRQPPPPPQSPEQQRQAQEKKDDQKQKQQEQQAQQQKSSPPQQKPSEKGGALENYDKIQATALLNDLRENERNWNFFPEVQMKDLKDSGEPAKDW